METNKEYLLEKIKEAIKDKDTLKFLICRKRLSIILTDKERKEIEKQLEKEFNQ